jgi:hypothetical protein
MYKLILLISSLVAHFKISDHITYHDLTGGSTHTYTHPQLLLHITVSDL